MKIECNRTRPPRTNIFHTRFHIHDLKQINSIILNFHLFNYSGLAIYISTTAATTTTVKSTKWNKITRTTFAKAIV